MSIQFTRLEAITPQWLTNHLRESGHLAQGAVESIDFGETIDTKASFATPITVSYIPGSSESAPRWLFFKRTRPNTYWGLAAEVIFYKEFAAEAEGLAIPRHYFAFADHEQQVCALIQEDVSFSHERLAIPLPPDRPTTKEWEQVVDELVKLHVHWWNHPLLAERLVDEQGGPLNMAHAATIDVIQRYGRQMAERFPSVVANWGDALSPEWKAVCERVIGIWPELLSRRINSGLGLTMIHGDYHLWNIFFPRANKPDTPVSCTVPLILDWETFKRGVGVYDLAYLLIGSGHRKQQEQPMLKRYHDGILEAGINNYTWASCEADYRLSIIACLFPPLKWERIEALAWVMAAFEEWSCSELIRQ